MIQPVALFASVMTAFAASGGAQPPAPVPSRADSGGGTAGVAVTSMDLQLWPEYDDPGVLAIYEGRLRPSASTPIDFTFLVPAGARIHMVGGIDERGRHLHAEYSSREREDGLVEITYRLEVPTFYMEFYYDPFSGRDRREFTYPVVSAFPVDSLVVAVQKPLRAEGFGVKPPTGEMVRDRKGFEYRVLHLGARAAGEETPITVSYRKMDRRPSVDPDEASTPPASPDGGTGSSGKRTLFLLLGIAAVLGGSAGLYPSVRGWVGGRRKEGESRGKRRAATKPGGRPPRPERYCTACGEALVEGANYCGACGQPTRQGGQPETEGRRTPAAGGESRPGRARGKRA